MLITRRAPRRFRNLGDDLNYDASDYGSGGSGQMSSTSDGGGNFWSELTGAIPNFIQGITPPPAGGLAPGGTSASPLSNISTTPAPVAPMAAPSPMASLQPYMPILTIAGIAVTVILLMKKKGG